MVRKWVGTLGKPIEMIANYYGMKAPFNTLEVNRYRIDIYIVTPKGREVEVRNRYEPSCNLQERF